jgi:RNA polymerase sigma-70 factor (ECF subfamily)
MMILIVLPDLSTEDRLLAQAKRGDQLAIMRIYDAFFTPVYQYIRLRVGDAMTAEDLTSEVFVKLITALRGPSAPRDTLRGWLFRVARNAVIDYAGKIPAMPEATLEEWVRDSTDEQPEVAFLRAANEQRARNAVRMLAADQQEVLVLRFGQQLSLQETADVMGKSLSAVKSLQWRAVETLRGILTGDSAERSA